MHTPYPRSNSGHAHTEPALRWCRLGGRAVAIPQRGSRAMCLATPVSIWHKTRYGKVSCVTLRTRQQATGATHLPPCNTKWVPLVATAAPKRARGAGPSASGWVHELLVMLKRWVSPSATLVPLTGSSPRPPNTTITAAEPVPTTPATCPNKPGGMDPVGLRRLQLEAGATEPAAVLRTLRPPPPSSVGVEGWPSDAVAAAYRAFSTRGNCPPPDWARPANKRAEPH